MTILNAHTTNDYDGVWKDGLDYFFRHFLRLFFPAIHADIDWKRGYKALDKELTRIVPPAEVGKQVVDKLFQVYRKQGQPALIYIHLEVQAQRDRRLPERIYIYNCLLFLRYKKPILSLVVLGDDQPKWRPGEFSYDLWGGGVRLTFPTVKLWDYRNRLDELKQSGNPFAYFVMAHLRTLETQKDSHRRFKDKEAIVLEMMELGLSQNDAYRLFKIIDGLMSLPKELEQTFLNKIQKYQEEKKMPFIAPFEIILMEKGLQKGLKQGLKQGEQKGSNREAQAALLDIMRDRFGKLPAALTQKIKNLDDLSLLRSLRKKAMKAKSLEDIQILLVEKKK